MVMNSKQKKYVTILALSFLIAVTILLRLPMLNYGMPFDLGDEDENGFIGCALNYGATKSVRPILTWYPAFYTSVLAPSYALYYLFASLIGDISNTTDFAVKYLMYPGYFHFIGRLMSIIFSSISIILLYSVGKTYRDRKTGILAAAMFTFSTVTLIRTAWALPDSTYLLLTVLSILFLIRFVNSDKTKHIIWSGFFCGLAIATKYNVGTLIIVGLSGIILSIWNSCADLGPRQRIMKFVRSKLIYIYGIFICLGFIIGTPYFIIDVYAHLDGLSWEIGRLGNEQSGSSFYFSRLPYAWIFSEMVIWERGLGLVIIIGLFYALYRSLKGDKSYLLFLPYIFITFLLIGKYQKHSLHYLLPAFPAIFLVSAYAVSQLLELKKKKLSLVFVFIVILVIISGNKLITYRDNYVKEDTRIAARNWILDNLPKGSKIALGRTINAPPLPDIDRFARERYSMIGEQVMRKKLPGKIKRGYAEKLGKEYYHVENYIVKQTEGRGASYKNMITDFKVLDLNQIGAEEPDYFIYSSFDKGFLKSNGFKSFKYIPGFSKKLQIVKKFSRVQDGLVGPEIIIYTNK